MMMEGTPGMSADTARAIVIEHVDKPCEQCRGERCWMLEWALKIVLDGPADARRDMLGAITHAARRTAKVHQPGADNLCSACVRPECEPYTVAAGWLAVIKELPPADPLPQDIADARLVIKAHQGQWGCPTCGPDGCPTEDWAAQMLVDAGEFGAIVGVDLTGGLITPGPKTLDDIERIARELRGDND